MERKGRSEGKASSGQVGWELVTEQPMGQNAEAEGNRREGRSRITR